MKMYSDYAGDESNLKQVSQMGIALKKLSEKIDTKYPEGQYKQNVIISTKDVYVRNNTTSYDYGLDIEFEVNFDDDTEADEAEITIYNMTDKTINLFKHNAEITIKAGYGNDFGIIFKGYIISKKTYFDEVDKITEIIAVDDRKRQGREIESISYAEKTKASYILKDLCKKVGLPIAVFKTARDYTYTDEVTVDGDLANEIKRYAKVCGVSAYVCKQKLYVRPLKDGDNTQFKLSADTGLLSVSEFEEESEAEEFKDVIKGFEIECLLQHRMQTASIIQLYSKAYKGTFRVRSGVHRYDGDNFITRAKIIQV